MEENEENKLGKLTPVSLVNTMWFNSTQHFGLSGVQRAHQPCRWRTLLERLIILEEIILSL